MRRPLFLLSAALLLAACQLGPPDAAPGTQQSPITGDAISVTSLDAAPAAADTPASPPPATADSPATDSPTAVSPPISPEQRICQRRGGSYVSIGKGGSKTCVRRTRDAGKQCRKQSDCDGYCLARSGTCAPISPMLGCNDILQDDGRKVTLCID